MAVKSQKVTEIHEADVNMPAVANTTRKASNAGNPEYLVFKRDEPPDTLQSMQIGAAWLEKVNQP